MLRTILASAVIVLAVGSFASAGKLKGKVTHPGDNGLVTSVYAANAENPIYQGQGTAGNNPLYKGNERISPPGFSNIGYPSINAAGAIAFQSVTDSPATSGIFVRPAGGGGLITINGSSFRTPQAAPIIGDGGDIVFGGIASSPGGGMPVVKFVSGPAGGGQAITIFGADFGARGAPTMNAAGDVAVEGVTPTGENALFVRPAGGAQVLTLRGSDFRSGATLTDPHLDAGRLTATAHYMDGTDKPVTEIVSSDRAADGSYSPSFPGRWKAPELNSHSDTHFAVLLGNAIAPQGMVAACDGKGIFLCGRTDQFIVSLPENNPAILAPEQLSPGTVIAVGDALGGSTVSGLSLAPQSWNADGSLTFFASLADGSSGLFVYTLPEPTTLAVLAATLPLFGRRRLSIVER